MVHGHILLMLMLMLMLMLGLEPLWRASAAVLAVGWILPTITWLVWRVLLVLLWCILLVLLAIRTLIPSHVLWLLCSHTRRLVVVHAERCGARSCDTHPSCMRMLDVVFLAATSASTIAATVASWVHPVDQRTTVTPHTMGSGLRTARSSHSGCCGLAQALFALPVERIGHRIVHGAKILLDLGLLHGARAS